MTSDTRASGPYKFLDYYEYEDAPIFFGRDTETEVLLSDIISERLILLFAKTGSGKTSLIKAGVMPRLAEFGYRPVYVRVEKDPVISLREELKSRRLLPDDSEVTSLAGQLLRVVAEGKKPLAVFFDQFEEFFIYVGDEAREEFIASVAQLYHDRGSGVHFVFSFREEFFVEMGEFRDQIPNIFHNDSNLRLGWFGRKEARDAICEPALKYGAKVEKRLVAAVLKDLGVNRRVEPARLQIVCSTLWREKERGGRDALLYDDYKRLGRATAIIKRRVVEDIGDNLDDAQLRLFERMLPELLTRIGAETEYTRMQRGRVFNEVLKPVKRGRTFEELFKALWPEAEGEMRAAGGVEREERRAALSGLLAKLKGLHLLKEVERYDDIYYEWTSDYLADLSDSLRRGVESLIVRRTLDDAVLRAEREKAEPDEYGFSAAASAHTEAALEALYMSAADFAYVSERAHLLDDLNARQASFMFVAALEHGAHMWLWFEKARAAAGAGEVWRAINAVLTENSAPSEMGENAIRLLGEVGRRPEEEKAALEGLQAALGQDALAPLAVRVLSEMQTKGALDLLGQALGREALGGQIIDRLSEVKTEASVELIARALSFPDLSTRALQTLGSIAKGRAGRAATLAAQHLTEWRIAEDRRRPTVDVRRRPGPFVYREAAASRGIGESEWQTLLDRISRGRCTPILGPSLAGGWRPSHAKIARQWAEHYNYPLADAGDLPRVAEFLAVTQDPVFPKDLFADLIRAWENTDPPAPESDDPYRILADLPLPVYVTTTYDDSLLRALLSSSVMAKAPQVDVCRWRKEIEESPSLSYDYTPSAAQPFVYHLHGRVNDPVSMVLTEGDYIEFLTNVSRDPQRIPIRIQKALTGSTLLFIGFDIDDWEFRVLYKGVITPMAALSLSRKHYTIQPPPRADEPSARGESELLQYRELYFAKDRIRVYWKDAGTFLAELRDRWRHFSES